MRAILALVVLVVAGCGHPATSPNGGAAAAEIVYLVHNQIWRMDLDGGGSARLGTAGGDPYPPGFPRRLDDGRVALLADDTGAIYPYVTDGRSATTIGKTNVTLHDA